jgi:hypothetical protein
MNLNKKINISDNEKIKNTKNTQSAQSVKNSKSNYPISVNNQQCIGPCYYSNTMIIHPHTLDAVRNADYHFCPVNTFPYKNPITKEITLETIDKCIAPTARETQMDEILSENIIVPQFRFSSDYFVKVYYNIFSLEDLLKWIDGHKNDPYKTKERVFNNGMVVYGDQLTIIDHRLVYFVNEIMLKYLPKIYRHLKDYIFVVNNKVELINFDPDKEKENNTSITNTKETNDNISLVRAYIKSKFLGIDNIHQFMSKFVRYYKAEITDKMLSRLLTKYMIDYCIKRIKMTLEEKMGEKLDEKTEEKLDRHVLK